VLCVASVVCRECCVSRVLCVVGLTGRSLVQRVLRSVVCLSVIEETVRSGSDQLVAVGPLEDKSVLYWY